MVVAAEAPAQIPKARPCSSPWKLAVMMESEPGTSRAPAAPWRIRLRIRNSMVGAIPHSRDVPAKERRPTANIRFRPW